MELDALEAGAAYALFRHGQDRQTEQLLRAAEGLRTVEAEPEPVLVNALDFATQDTTDEWDDYVGQVALKRRLRVHIEAAKARGDRLDHVLLASGMPGVGKTKMARILAKEMGGQIIEMVPPFNLKTLAEAACELSDGDILFIDEIHKLADNGKRGAEILLKLLEDHVLYMGHTAIQVADITVVGATTDLDMLPEPVIDRFKIKPHFEQYSEDELIEIAGKFMDKHHVYTDWTVTWAIAKASRSTPRLIEEMVMAVRDLQDALGRDPSAEEMLAFVEREPTGLDRQHVNYLTTMARYNKRENAAGKIEFVAGEAQMMSMLRETRQGIQRIERFLMEQGFLDKTPRGRRLTHQGLEAAIKFIKEGK